jgi:hypothetical protein
MSRDFQIIQLTIDEDALTKLGNRQRNQLVGCMHAHNELTVLNRILMFSMNNTGLWCKRLKWGIFAVNSPFG